MKLNWNKYKNPYDYNTQREQYRKDEGRIHQEFRDDALKAVGMFGHPKADKVYALAWENGHSAGFQEVFNHLIGLAGLFAGDPVTGALPFTPKVKVEIIESERGWGQRVDEVKEFDTPELATEFIKQFNSKNNKEHAPDWYMFARLQGGR